MDKQELMKQVEQYINPVSYTHLCLRFPDCGCYIDTDWNPDGGKTQYGI